MPNYDVVIVNYNGAKILKKCLSSIFSSSQKPKKVIIYDNSSQDNSVEIIRKYFPSVVIIAGKKNIGFGPANNLALKYAVSKFVLFMNNDVILDKKCAQRLVWEINRRTGVAVVNPIIFRGWDRSEKSVYSFGAEINTSGFGYGLFDRRGNDIDLNCFSGACFIACRNIISKLQFENKFFLYYEEPDLSIRILNAGYSIGRLDTAKCYHLENYSSPKNKAQGICFRQYYAIQNRWYMIGKYWPAGLLLRALPLNIAHLFYNLLYFIKSGDLIKLNLLYLAVARLYQGRRSRKKFSGAILYIKLSPSNLRTVIEMSQKVYS